MQNILHICILYNYINETLVEFSAYAVVPQHLQITLTSFLSSISDMINQKSYAIIKIKVFICFTLPLP
jgi:hypothetical protein